MSDDMSDHMRTVSPRSAARTRLLLDGTGPDREAHLARYGVLPHPGLADLLAEVHDSGLTGRGGGGFPTAAKVRAVAEPGSVEGRRSERHQRGAMARRPSRRQTGRLSSGGNAASVPLWSRAADGHPRIQAVGSRRPVVVGNGLEGEPLSAKDVVLLARNPHLVLDGLELLARALRARRAILAVPADTDASVVLAAARDRGVEVVPLQGGFVAGQESALVHQLDGGPALPRDPFTRVTESGVGGRPTLVLNVETLAQLALVVRYGGSWFRSTGVEGDPGTSLFTISGSVRHPGVVEVERGRRLQEVLAAADPLEPAAVLVGGYHGAWIPAPGLGVRLTDGDLTTYGASVGAGVLHVIDAGVCPIGFAAEVASYLASESTGQCGPCLNGLPRMASDLGRLAAGVRDPGLPGAVRRMSRLVTGRGACAHPDGSARFVASTMEVFRGHVAAHLEGWCPSEQRRAVS